MHQSGEVCVFFIKMLHSINLSSREDTGGPGAQLSGLSLLMGSSGCPSKHRCSHSSWDAVAVEALLLFHRHYHFCCWLCFFFFPSFWSVSHQNATVHSKSLFLLWRWVHWWCHSGFPSPGLFSSLFRWWGDFIGGWSLRADGGCWWTEVIHSLWLSEISGYAVRRSAAHNQGFWLSSLNQCPAIRLNCCSFLSL